MNKCRTILRVISDFEKFFDLLILRIAVSDSDVEITQPQLLHLRFFFRGAMLAGLSKVNDRLYTISLELEEVFGAGLATSTELLIDLQEISDRRNFLGRSRRLNRLRWCLRAE